MLLASSAPVIVSLTSAFAVGRCGTTIVCWLSGAVMVCVGCRALWDHNRVCRLSGALAAFILAALMIGASVVG